MTLSTEEDWNGLNFSCSGAGFVAPGACGTYDDMIDAAVAVDPVLVIVPASSNDLRADQATLKARMSGTMQRLRAALPHATIVGLSAIWNDRAAPARLTEISNDLEAAVASIGGEYLDIGEPVSGHPEWVQLDTVHYTRDGYDAVARAVGAALTDAGIRP